MSNQQDPPIVVSGGIIDPQSSSAIPGPILNGVLWQLNAVLPPDPPIIMNGGDGTS
jgi:hypothetical protein